MAFDNNQNGTPLIRPLFFEESNNNKLFVNDKTYLWGEHFLVSPVMKPGIKTQDVYFPSNSNWYNFYTNEKVVGGQSISVKLKEESIPTYVRGGAFIPMIKTIQNTAQYSLNEFDLHFYFDANISESEDKLYNDDGVTPNAFEKGNYELLTFESELKKNRLEIEIEQKTGDNYNFSSKEINLIVHNISKEPKKIKGYKSQWNKGTKTLNIQVKLDSPTSKSIKIKL